MISKADLNYADEVQKVSVKDLIKGRTVKLKYFTCYSIKLDCTK